MVKNQSNKSKKNREDIELFCPEHTLEKFKKLEEIKKTPKKKKSATLVTLSKKKNNNKNDYLSKKRYRDFELDYHINGILDGKILY